MIAPLRRIAFAVGALVLIGCVPLTFVWPDGSRDEFANGLLFGTMFGQTTVASAWIAIGPGRLAWRRRISMAWIAALITAFWTQAALRNDADVAVSLAISLIGQWLVVQLPFWALARGSGVQLQYVEDAAQTTLDARSRQFGIRQLLLVTLIVAVILGAGRLLATSPLVWRAIGREVMVFLFLMMAAVMMTVPLLIACLMRGWAVPAVIGLVFSSVAFTAGEIQLVRSLGVFRGFTPGDFIWINIFSLGWVVVLAAAVRLCGYSLGTPVVKA